MSKVMKTRTIIQSDLSKSQATLILSVLCQVLSIFAKVGSKHFEGKMNEKHQTLEMAILCILCGADLVIAR
jgi:hypothetical protein